MSNEKINIPRANFLVGSMRSIGYTFESAIADVIDNSISANCHTIHVLFPSNPMERLAVGILDDGEGMSDEELFEAMRYGSSSCESRRSDYDLGRFGLGMKSASLSTCRILTVASKHDGVISAYTWDYNFIVERKDWYTIQHTKDEIEALPYVSALKENGSGTLVIWQDFDVISKSSNGQVFETLSEYKTTVNNHLALIYHRFLNSSGNENIKIYINNSKVMGLDPFLENHAKTTTKKEVVIAIEDSDGLEQKVRVKPFILPYATDLKAKDRKLVGGLESLKSKQGFYVYRNNRLIVWGTWFGMRPRSELTKNARIRVDFPNSLDDIFKIDVKKQTAYIPKRIQNQLKHMVSEALEISITKQTHRGRREDLKEVDYIWSRLVARDNRYYYQVNRDSRLLQLVRDHLTSEGVTYLDLLLKEIDRNLPLQQIYIDKSNEVIAEETEDRDTRFNNIFNLAITMVEAKRNSTGQNLEDIIESLKKVEPFCNLTELINRLNAYYANNEAE